MNGGSTIKGETIDVNILSKSISIKYINCVVLCLMQFRLNIRHKWQAFINFDILYTIYTIY